MLLKREHSALFFADILFERDMSGSEHMGDRDSCVTRKRQAMRVHLWALSFAFLTSGATTVRAAEASPPPAFSWAGAYIGMNMGGAIPLYDSERLQALSGFGLSAYDLYPASRVGAGVTFGLQAGYNWQYQNWVYGLETDFNFLDGQRAPMGTFVAPPSYAATGVNSYSLNPDSGSTYFSSLRGRLGFAVDRTLYYLTGGFANGGWRGASTLTLNGGGPGNPFNAANSQSSQTKYALGAGVEYAFADHWSARAEYLFLNQSRNAQIFANAAGFVYAPINQADSHILRFGVNYHFDEQPSAPAASEVREEKKKSETPEPETYSVHTQLTVLPQGYPKFSAPYSGAHSLPSSGQVRSTVSATAFLGVRLWQGAEAYVTPEIDQGFGLADTYGLAGFASAEAYKIGRAAPYLRFQRYFLRQVIGLGGETENLDPGQDVIGSTVDKNRVAFTVGKFAIVDYFDDNRYAHDGRNGFMNWSIIDMGAFDYAGDAWSYTNGAMADWKQDWWSVRGGVFQLSQAPGSEQIEPVLFRQFSPVVELEARHRLLFDQPGKIKLLGFANIGYMGKYEDALAAGYLTGTTPDISLDRRKRTKVGGGINVEQPITSDLGFFLRASAANGRYESFDFTDIERSLSAGFVLTGERWDRPKDAIGLAGVANGVSGSHANYLAAGGLGLLVGDGALSYGGEHVMEAYYKYSILDGFNVTFDYQLADNPAYNRARGPVNIFALRVHAEY